MILAQLSQLAAHQAALGMYLFQDSGQAVGFPQCSYGEHGLCR